MKTFLPTFLLLILASFTGNSQVCTALGDQTTYGTNNVWRGYVYDNANLTSYKGYVTEGTTSNPNFDESFGGSNTNYSTNGCSAQTETFSVRYKLTKAFTSGSYTFTVGGDDGYRLSLDGGTTWVINNWNDHSYTTSTYTITLNGTHNLVLEYYENGGENRITIAITTPCGTENTATYGTSNSWNGYLYRGTSFNTYIGMIHEGSATDGSFTENFGGNNTTFGTSSCTVQTEGFSARFRLTKTFVKGYYTFFLGGDDGYRLSIDGGNTFIINKWFDQTYNVSNATVYLNGTYNLVIEYYENSGENQLSFSYQFGATLAIKLISFNGEVKNNATALTWTVSADSDPNYFDVEKSQDGIHFTNAGTVKASAGRASGGNIAYQFNDQSSLTGKSYYRLKMTDLSGVITYSDLVSVSTSTALSTAIKVFPTIVTGSVINIQPDHSMNNATITLMDLTGKVLSTQHIGRISSGQVVSFQQPVKSGSNAMYLVSVNDESGFSYTGKVIIR